jgi:hypothetical protein
VPTVFRPLINKFFIKEGERKMDDTNLLEIEVPEKFKDSQTGEVRVEALLRSYNELENKLSKRPFVPKSHHDYCIDCTHGYFDPDEDLNRRFHERGFTQDQVQFVYDMAAQKMMPLIVQMATGYEADRELEKLVEHFGGERKWREVSRQLLAYGQKNLPDDALDALASSAEGVKALYRMMQEQRPADIGRTPQNSSPDMAELDLQAMMRDPKYWRDRDPSFIAKVTEGFKRIYSE